MGLRTDDVICAVKYLSARPEVDASKITGAGDGNLGRVLLHAAVLEARLKHITIDHALSSYRSLVDAPLPPGATEDVLPGVLGAYDIPDLVRASGSRLTETSR